MTDATESAPAWIGNRIDDMSGGRVGRVEGFFVSESDGASQWLLARMGRFGHYTLIPARDAVEGVGHVWVPYSREQIRKAPRVEPDEPVAAAAEGRLLEHYGVAVDTERAVGARPA